MRTWAWILTFSLLVAGAPASASRVLEIEEFYHKTVKELLETRFPETPFSVFVTVDTGRSEPTRKDVQVKRQNQKGGGAQLPFWYADEDQEELDVWDRMDVPLGTLIKQVKSVIVNIRVDAALNESELTELKDLIAKQVKLDPTTDRIEISRMNWSDRERFRNIKWVGGLAAVVFLLGLTAFFLLARLSVRQLVKGLSQPITEIGNSTKKFASNALSLASDIQGQGGRDRTKEETATSLGADSMDLNLLEIRKSALELLERNLNLFEQPDASFMDFVERKGKMDPVTMGSILAELKKEALRDLFRFGSGDWWYKAVAQPAPLRAQSLALLGEIDRLRVRRQFGEDHTHSTQEHREFALTLNRLAMDELSQVMKGLSLEVAAPILDLLPREHALGVAKKVFPGQWAIFLQSREDHPQPDNGVLKELRDKALNVRPLRGEGEIKSFFKDLDLTEYLDIASPRDERDFYLVLPEDSRIKKQRYPLFRVLEGDEKVIKVLGSSFSPWEWAIALKNCDAGDRRLMLEKFTDRLRFQVIEQLKSVESEGIDEVSIRRVRRTVVRAYVEELNRQSALASVEALTSGGQNDEQKGSDDGLDSKTRAA